MKTTTELAALALTCALSLTACNGSSPDAADTSTETDSTPSSTQIASPITEYGSISEAADAAGFAFDVPESIGTYGNRAYLVISAGTDDALIEVSYTKTGAAADATATDARDEYIVRKAAGSLDVSGDYNDYAEVTNVDTDAACYTLKGNDGLVNLVTWERDGYSYSFAAYGGAALASADAEEIASHVW